MIATPPVFIGSAYRIFTTLALGRLPTPPLGGLAALVVLSNIGTVLVRGIVNQIQNTGYRTVITFH